MPVLEDRLRGRGTDSEDVIAHRLALADRELDAVRFFDYAVINDEVPEAVKSVLEIIEAERGGRGSALKARFGREAVLSRWRRS